MAKRYSIDGKALSSLRVGILRQEILKREPTFTASYQYCKKQLKQHLASLLEDEKNGKLKLPTTTTTTTKSTTATKKRKLTSDDEDEDDEDEEQDDEEEQQERINKILTKLKNKRIKHHQELITKNQKVVQLEKTVEELNLKVKELEEINNNNNNNNTPTSTSSDSDDIKSAIKLYNKLLKKLDYTSTSTDSDDDENNNNEDEIKNEFLKFIVLKIMDNDYNLDSPKLLPSLKVLSFWKKIAIDTNSYSKLLKILGKNRVVHFKKSNKDENQKLNRKKYKKTLELYSKYFPESSVIRLDKKNNDSDSIWPLKYLKVKKPKKLPKPSKTPQSNNNNNNNNLFSFGNSPPKTNTATTTTTTTTTTTASTTPILKQTKSFVFGTNPFVVMKKPQIAPISTTSPLSLSPINSIPPTGAWIDIKMETPYEIRYYSMREDEEFSRIFNKFAFITDGSIYFEYFDGFKKLLLSHNQTPQQIGLKNKDRINVIYVD